uniref:Uncharacterized protein n=1 Tax=Cucumis melo TaxID=3656 RepID=A0A9I9E882_CUCME
SPKFIIILVVASPHSQLLLLRNHTAAAAPASLLSTEIFGDNLLPFIRSHHRYLSSPSSFYSSLAQAATPQTTPLSVSQLLCVATFRSEASGLCLLQSVFVHKASTAIVASPRTQPPPSQSPIHMELSLLHHPSFSVVRCRTRVCSPHR